VTRESTYSLATTLPWVAKEATEVRVRFPLVLVVTTCAAGIAAGASFAPALDEIKGLGPVLDILDVEPNDIRVMTSLDGADAVLGTPLAMPGAPEAALPGVHATLRALAVAPAFLPFPLLPGDEMLVGGNDILFPHGLAGSSPGMAHQAFAQRQAGAPLATTLPSDPAPATAPPAASRSSGTTPTDDARAQSTLVAPPPPSGTIAVVAASGAALGFLGLLGVALYHRIRPTTTLENDTRKQIFDAVCQTPGLGVHLIAEQAGVSYSTATYHLERLTAAGMIVMTPNGNKLCYYKNGGAFTEVERRILPLLKNDEAAKLLDAIMENPGTYRAALAERLGVTATTINWHLRRLREAGLVQEDRQGRNAFLYANVLIMQQSLPGLALKLSAADVTVTDRIRRYVGNGNAGLSASS